MDKVIATDSPKQVGRKVSCPSPETQRRLHAVEQKAEVLQKGLAELNTKHNVLSEREERGRITLMEKHGNTAASIDQVLIQLKTLSDQFLVMQAKDSTKTQVFTQWVPLILTGIYTFQLIYQNVVK